MNLPGRSPSGREAENLHYHTSQPHTINTVTNGSKSMEFDYDANGNMTEVVNKTGSTVTSTETLFWNESNQLQTDHNLGGLHHFMYDSNGERYLKGTLLFNSVDVDGNPISGTDVSTSDYTVYVNPYMVYNSKYETNSGYSKHYYVGSERVASAIGTGDFKGNSDPQTGPSTESLTAHPIWSVLNDYLDDLEIEIGGYDGYESTEGEPLHSTYESCIETYGSDQDEIDNCLCLYFPSYAQSQSINCENYAPIYWYHPDYLGNTEFVSDRMGRPYQHFYYSPFGEELVEQEPYNADYNSPYHFNAKEVDPETGFHYYGARYYNSNLSVWLSVDALASKFGHISPYAYVENNPVMLIDPNGLNPYLIFNGTRGTMSILDDGGTPDDYSDDILLGTYIAHNNVTRSSKGKWEDGIYPMIDRNTAHKHGTATDRHDVKLGSDNGAYGSGGIFRAENFTEAEDNGGDERVGMGIHAGRENRDFEARKTLGCWRITPQGFDAIEEAISEYGPLGSTIVQENLESPESDRVNNIKPQDMMGPFNETDQRSSGDFDPLL